MAGKSTVVLLPTLHQFHAVARTYGFRALQKLIDDLRPDVLALELTQADVESRQPQRSRMEYQKCVFPYLDLHELPVIALEPGEPLFSQLVQQLDDAKKAVKQASPQRHAEFQDYALDLFSQLLQSWESPAAVDSPRTEQVLAEKHERQARLYGSSYQDARFRWNEHFAQTIGAAARAHPGKRIVALVGVDHVHLLRPRLDEAARSSGKWSLAPRLRQHQHEPG